MGFKEDIAMIAKVFEQKETLERAGSVLEAKMSMFAAAMTGKLNEKEIEQARQECIDAFSAVLDVKIAGAWIMDDIMRKMMVK